MTTDTCIECEVNLAKYKFLERDYDRMNMEAQRDKDMMEAMMQKDGTNADFDFNLVRQDLSVLEHHDDPKCHALHANFCVLLDMYESVVEQRNKYFKVAEISCKHNRIMGSSQMLQRHSNRNDLESEIRKKHNIMFLFDSLREERTRSNS